jgi:hypothetical protein
VAHGKTIPMLPCWRCGAPSTRSEIATVPRRPARRLPTACS